MLDFGWSELLVIMALAVLVMGPEEIPKIMVTLGRIMRRLQYVRYAFTQQFEEFLNEADLQDINKQVNFEMRAPRDSVFDEVSNDVSENQIPAKSREETDDR